MNMLNDFQFTKHSFLPIRSFCDICLFAILPDIFRVHCKITWPVVN